MRNRYSEKPKNFSHTINRLLSYLSKDIILIIFAGFIAVIAALMGVLTPYLAGKALTLVKYIYDGEEALVSIFSFLPLFNFVTLIIVIILTALLTSLFNYLQSFLLIGMTQRLTYKMRIDLTTKVNSLPLKFFDKYKYGDILSRITNDVDMINQTLTQSISEIFRAITLVTSILVIMFLMSWELALITTGSVIISLIVAGIFVKISQKYFVRAAKSTGDMTGHVEEVFHGHQVVKIYNYQDKALAEFETLNDEIFDSSFKSQFISSIMFPVQFFFTNLAYIGIGVIGGYLLIKGQIEVGFILTYVLYARQVGQPIQTIGQTASVLQQTSAAAERIFFIMDQKEEDDESNKKLLLPNIKGKVEFDNLQFSYIKDKPVIKGFTAKVKPGDMVAIVGPTGAGKTTIVNLLMRFYELDDGDIKIDDISIKDMKRTEVRDKFGMVLQDTWIFEGSIYENIVYGSNGKTYEDVEKATKNAMTHHFIHSLPNSYDFILKEDGENISQGQRQLITISRAMLADKPMLILDEATSSVDTRTEILIQKAMDKLMKGRTSFVIAHRLSTIRNADVIFVVRDGNIIESGNHDALIEKDGFYAELYNSQFEGQEI